jgi:hypothetical protein
MHACHASGGALYVKCMLLLTHDVADSDLTDLQPSCATAGGPALLRDDTQSSSSSNYQIKP